MRKFTIVALSLSLSLVLGTNVLAQEEHRQLGAHVHGHGKLNIALEGKQLEMELEVPSMDIVGFGHKPSTPEQKAIMKKARQTLANGALLFVLSKAARCRQISSKVGREKHEEDKEKKEHSEFHAKYVFECASPEKLTSIRFAFFEHFTRSKELDVALITEKRQSQHEVNRDKPVLDGFVQ